MTSLSEHLSVLRRDRRVDWLIVLILALAAAVWLFDRDQFAPVIGIAARALLSTSVYIAVAVGLLAYLRAAGADAMVARAFEGNQTRMIIAAALIGGLAPFCSCEVIPFIASLLALGAPLSAVMAFWLSSPLIDPPTLLITAGALGWPLAIAKGAAAVGIGLLGGFGMRAMIAAGAFSDPLRPRERSACGCGPSPLSGQPEWRFWREPARRETFRREAVSNAIFLLRWLALAYMLEALLITYAPAEMIASVVGGDGVGPIILSALVGMPAYLNGYAAPPLVAGLIEQGMQPGAALAFLVAGAVSCIPAMAAVFSLVKRPVFAAYVAFGLIGAVLAGLSFQLFVA